MRKKIYLGHGSKSEVFRSDSVPTKESHGQQFVAVVGPFQTVRGAKAMLWYGGNNPHIQNVADAERVGRIYAKELKLLGKFKTPTC